MIKTSNKIAHLFRATSTRESTPLPSNSAKFSVKLKKLLVGTLSYKNGIWFFQYSEDFKNQESFSPIVNFPDKTRNYSSKELWPFFIIRIPTPSQLQQKANKETEDMVYMLKKYGRRTISNSYELYYGE